MTTDQWAVSARSNIFWQNDAEQKTITTYQDLLEHRINPLQAAQAVTSTYVSRIEDGDVNSWYPWVILLDAIKNISTDANTIKLAAQFVKSISQIPEPLKSSGDSVKSDQNAQIFWRDVPGFAYAFRQALPYVLVEDLEGKSDSVAWEKADRELLNVNIFAAQYLQELDPNGPERDFASMRKAAQDHFMWALEIETESPGQLRRLDLYIPPAANWIQMAGKNVYEYCKENRDYGGENVPQRWMGGPKYGSELLWTGREGFTIERWAFWRKRFEDIAVLEGASSKVKNLAGQAAEEMAKFSRMDDVLT